MSSYFNSFSVLCHQDLKLQLKRHFENVRRTINELGKTSRVPICISACKRAILFAALLKVLLSVFLNDFRFTF